MKKTIFLLVVLASVLMIHIPLSNAGPSADYGDAPDDTQNPENVDAYPGIVAKFPSFYDTNNSRVTGRRGPYHINTSICWLGNQSSSTTTQEPDAKITDLDNDDCNYKIYVNYTSGYTWFLFDVTTSSQAVGSTYYVNILHDMDQDGEWRTAPWRKEWIVQNKRLTISPGKTRRVVIVSPISLLDLNCWTRITLATEKISSAVFGASGWDGSGPSAGFASGETEDWLFTPIDLDEVQCIDDKDFAIINTLATLRNNRCHVTIPCNNQHPGEWTLTMRNPGCTDLNIIQPIPFIWNKLDGPPECNVDITWISARVDDIPVFGDPIPLPVGSQIEIDFEATWTVACAAADAPRRVQCSQGHQCCSCYAPIINLDPENVTYYYEPDEHYKTQLQFFNVLDEEPPPPTCVGGIVDLYQWSSPIPWITLSVIVAAIAVTTVYVSKRRRRKPTQKD